MNNYGRKGDVVLFFNIPEIKVSNKICPLFSDILQIFQATFICGLDFHFRKV